MLEDMRMRDHVEDVHHWTRVSPEFANALKLIKVTLLPVPFVLPFAGYRIICCCAQVWLRQRCVWRDGQRVGAHDQKPDASGAQQGDELAPFGR